MAFDRRAFLKWLGAGVGAVGIGRGPTLAAAVRQPAPAGGQGGAPEVVVVGAGVFGGWTALYLRERGVRVTLVDAFGAGNSRASSGGETRQIRPGYADRELYTRWVLTALDRWKAREQEFGRPLFIPTGRLILAPDWNASLKATKTVLDKYRVPHEVLTHGELARRYPQMNAEGIGVALYEPTTGLLRAREGCLAVAEAFAKKGGRVTIARAEPGEARGGRLQNLSLSNGTTLSAQTFVFACGPWLRKVFPDLLGRKLFTPRRDVFFFGPPPGDARFMHPNFPNFSEDAAGFYGFTSIDHRGFKVCPTGEPLEFDPDSDERLPSPYYLKRARDYLARRFPALKDQPILESRVCQLEMSVDEHFIIDRHPGLDNVWIAGGGSGHGYKHGPVVGEYIANRVTGRDREPELEAVFRLKEETF